MQYWEYFLTLLKNPSYAFQLQEDKFVFGIVNAVLFAITFSLSIFFTINVLYKSSVGMVTGMFGGESSGLSVFSVALPIILFVFVLLVAAFAVIVVMEKSTLKQNTYKQLFAQYNGLLVPFIAINLLGI